MNNECTKLLSFNAEEIDFLLRAIDFKMYLECLECKENKDDVVVDNHRKLYKKLEDPKTEKYRFDFCETVYLLEAVRLELEMVNNLVLEDIYCNLYFKIKRSVPDEIWGERWQYDELTAQQRQTQKEKEENDNKR